MKKLMLLIALILMIPAAACLRKPAPALPLMAYQIPAGKSQIIPAPTDGASDTLAVCYSRAELALIEAALDSCGPASPPPGAPTAAKKDEIPARTYYLWIGLTGSVGLLIGFLGGVAAALAAAN